MVWNEPRHDKTNKMSVRPVKTWISLGICQVKSVFPARMKKAWVLSYPLSAQRRLWSDWVDALADLSLRWALTHFVVLLCRNSNAYHTPEITMLHNNAINWNFLKKIFFLKSFNHLFKMVHLQHIYRIWYNHWFAVFNICCSLLKLMFDA